MNDEKSLEITEGLVKSIASLNELCSQQEDSAAAMLYRLMFRHERNINILDNCADKILDTLLGFGSEYAEEDYRNYLQYLKTVLPEEYEGHKEMFEEDMKDLQDDDFDGEESK